MFNEQIFKQVFTYRIMDAANEPNNQVKPTASVPVKPNHPKNRWQELPADRPKRSWKPSIVSLFCWISNNLD